MAKAAWISVASYRLTLFLIYNEARSKCRIFVFNIPCWSHNSKFGQLPNGYDDFTGGSKPSKLLQTFSIDNNENEVAAKGRIYKMWQYFCTAHSILFYSILFYSILFYSILFYSILFYSILFYSMCLFTLLTWCSSFHWYRSIYVLIEVGHDEHRVGNKPSVKEEWMLNIFVLMK